MLTQEKLKSLITYNAETGEFHWLTTGNGRRMDRKIITSKPNGYMSVVIDRKRYYLHRLAWLYTHGYFPEQVVDHINGNRSDNRLCNLREVSHSCNIRNSTTRKNNACGHTGICMDKRRNKWMTYINIGGKTKFLGYFDELNDAVERRRAAEKEHSASWCYVQGRD